MRIAKNEVPAKIDVPGAKARQITDFGDASGYGTIAGEYLAGSQLRHATLRSLVFVRGSS